MQPFAAILTLTEQAIYQATGENLSDLQRLILQELWQNTKKNYGQIAIEHNYSGNYIQQVAAPRLWRLLSNVFGQKITKSNMRRVLEQQLAQSTTPPNLSIPVSATQRLEYRLEYPTGSVPLDSPFYISRPQDFLCCQSILQPHTLLQIKAPRQMGKTSMMMRILSQAKTADYPSVIINFQQADRSILSDLEKLLRWLCINISRQLHQECNLEEYWNEEVGHKMSCTLYIEDHFLKGSETPIAIALEEVSELFEYPSVTQEFFTMIRSWHEQMKSNMIWEKLRVIVVYATEVNIPLHINQLPFDAGLEIELQPFTQKQVKDLIQRHGLEFTSDQTTEFMTLTQGNPHDVRLLLYRLAQQEISLNTLLKDHCASRSD
jgi:AAA-like domain